MGIYDEMAARIDDLETRVSEMEERERYIIELAANPNLSPGEKWAMWAVVRKLGRIAAEGEQLTEVEIWQVAKDIGMSAHQTGMLIKKLSEAGAIARKQRCSSTAEGKNGRPKVRKHILLGITLLTDLPGKIIHPQPRNHGGARKRCEKCGGENLEIYQAYICQDCHHIHQAELVQTTKGRHGFGHETE